MRKLLVGFCFAIPLMLAIPASALPGGGSGQQMNSSSLITNLIEVKGGGHGRGHGHGFGRGHGHRAWGWSRGRKVGWRGRGCPPGLWRQGRC